ncbi:hypothetical protein D3C87_1300530 [compost metagenome]
MTNTERPISSVEATAITGVRSWRRVVHIFTGRVCRVGLAIITLSTTSSHETRKAKRAPATMPGRIAGKVTLNTACRREAPQITAASSIDWSNSFSELMIEMMVNGSATITWLTTKANMVPV